MTDYSNYSSDQLGFSIDKLPKSLHLIVKTISQNDFQVYLVGGAIRDFGLGRTPKDFDLVTDATPEEILSLFPKSRIVGRRFPVVHVTNEGLMVEVSTLRKRVVAKSIASQIDTFSNSIEDDSQCRDFTINALYFDFLNKEVIDYSGGVQDLSDKHLRLIGDFDRLAEDPVRILRLIRFQAQLQFHLSGKLQEAVNHYRTELTTVSSGRLNWELKKMLLFGKSVLNWQYLVDFELNEILFPTMLSHKFSTEKQMRFIVNALKDTDLRVKNNRYASFRFLMSIFLWHSVFSLYQNILEKTRKKHLSFHMFCKAVLPIIARQNERVFLSKFDQQYILRLWFYQLCVDNRKKAYINEIITSRQYTAFIDFLKFRVNSGEISQNILNFWVQAQED